MLPSRVALPAKGGLEQYFFLLQVINGGITVGQLSMIRVNAVPFRGGSAWHRRQVTMKNHLTANVHFPKILDERSWE